MAATKDYYGTLGVPKTATEEEIRKAYKKLARKFHPDFNPGNKDAEKRFKEVNEAHGVLSDPEKRKRFDEFGEAGLRDGFNPKQAREWAKWAGKGGFSRGAGGAPGGFEFNFGGGGGGASNIEDILAAFGMGGGGGKRRRGSPGGPFGGFQAPPMGKGADIEASLDIDLSDALRTNTTATLGIDRGDGNQERVEVKIPQGVRDGQKIRLAGLGNPGPGGAGDLYVKIGVRDGKRIRRVDDDLVLEVPVTLGEAVNGAEITIPTPQGGEATVKVPPGTSSGQTLRLRGQGLKKKDGSSGDLLVRPMIRLPRGAGGASELKDAAERAEKLYGPDHPRSGFMID